MEFMQIVECRTSRPDEMKALADEYEKATEGKRTLRRTIVTRDRNDPDRHLVITFFDSYESAMVNSNLPETQEFGQKLAVLMDQPMTFTDVEVIEDRS